jgi:hypothetical protein
LPGKAADGQLALMDAIVFFVVAMAVTDMLLSMTSDYHDEELYEWFDAQRALSTFLRCSLGSEIEVTVSGLPMALPARTEIAECLLLEAHVIAEGDGPWNFDALETRLTEVLEASCGASMESRLSVFEICDGTPFELFSVPDAWRSGELVYAATAELADSGDGVYLVQLCSAPAVRSQALCVRCGDPYLGPGKLLSSDDVHILQDDHDRKKDHGCIYPDRRL